MKLSVKIFLSILIPSMISVFIISYILINKYSNSVFEFETEKSYQEYKDFNNRFTTSSYSDEELKDNLSKTSILNEDLDFSCYRNNNKLYSTNNINKNLNDLINVEKNSYNSLIISENGKHYLLISLRNNDKDVFVFYKNINYVYKNIYNLSSLCITISGLLVILILFVAYTISKTITRPLKNITREVNKIAKGNYDISLEEGKDEVGILSSNINIMSKEIKNRNNELIDLVDSKQLFIDNLSHEMNTPLTSIYGYTELFEKANLNDEQKQMAISYIKKETKRINEMYKKLLMLSYKENNKTEINKIFTAKLFEDLNIELKNKLEEKNISINYNSNIDYIMGDEMLISVALSNLIRNAINNSEINKHIDVNIYSDDTSNYIEVRDQGCGISSEDINKIIEPFYRVDKARSRNQGGAGLGLSIVKRVANLHNGELIIKSEIGVGSKFIIKISK